jgi:hypothetical protein
MSEVDKYTVVKLLEDVKIYDSKMKVELKQLISNTLIDIPTYDAGVNRIVINETLRNDINLFSNLIEVIFEVIFENEEYNSSNYNENEVKILLFILRICKVLHDKCHFNIHDFALELKTMGLEFFQKGKRPWNYNE